MTQCLRGERNMKKHLGMKDRLQFKLHALNAWLNQRYSDKLFTKSMNQLSPNNRLTAGIEW